MQISGSKVAIGAVIGAGIAAAAGLGIDGLVDETLARQGAEFTLDKLANSPDLVNQGVAYFEKPTFMEHVARIAGNTAEQVGSLFQVSDNGSIVANTLEGQVVVTDTKQLASLLEQGALSSAAQTQLQGIIEQFNAQIPAAPAAPVAVAPTALPQTSASELSAALKGLDASQSVLGIAPISGIEFVSPSQMQDVVRVPLAGGGDLYVNHEKLVEHFDTLAQGANPQQLEALSELKMYTDPMFNNTTLAAGAGAGALVGAGKSALESGQGKRFTDRVSPRQTQSAPSRGEGQSWAQAVQQAEQPGGQSFTR